MTLAQWLEDLRGRVLHTTRNKGANVKVPKADFLRLLALADAAINDGLGLPRERGKVAAADGLTTPEPGDRAPV